jgi:hypothetical protein
MTIRVRDLMPMFTAATADGTVVRYQDIWQRRNLLLVSLPSDDPTSSAYATSLGGLESSLAAYEAVLLIVTTRIEGVPSPGVVVADRWGEVYYLQQADRASALPRAEELMDWLCFVRNECPECQGETR